MLVYAAYRREYGGFVSLSAKLSELAVSDRGWTKAGSGLDQLVPDEIRRSTGELATTDSEFGDMVLGGSLE